MGSKTYKKKKQTTVQPQQTFGICGNRWDQRSVPVTTELTLRQILPERQWSEELLQMPIN